MNTLLLVPGPAWFDRLCCLTEPGGGQASVAVWDDRHESDGGQGWCANGILGASYRKRAVILRWKGETCRHRIVAASKRKRS